MCVYFVSNCCNHLKRIHLTDDCQQETAVARVDRHVCSDCFYFIFGNSIIFYAALADSYLATLLVLVGFKYIDGFKLVGSTFICVSSIKTFWLYS